MSQISNIQMGNGVAPIETLTGDTGGPVSPDGAGNIDVPGGAGANGAINIQTRGNATPNTLDIRLTDSVLLPATNTSGTEGIIGLGSTDYATDRFMHNFGSNNTFLGYQAGNLTLNGSNLVGIGYRAFNSVRSIPQSVDFSVAIGYNAATLMQNAGGGSVIIGASAVESCVMGGGYIVAIGQQALQDYPGKSTGGSVAVGWNAQRQVNAAVTNTSYGYLSLGNLTSGDRNEVYGYRAGENLTTTSDNLYLYHRGDVTDSNTIRIGTQGSGNYQQDTCFIAGIIGNTVSNAQLVTIDSTTGQLGVTDLQPFPWTVINSSQTAAVNNGYFCDLAGTLVLTLPATSAVGDVIEVANINTATGTQIGQQAGQTVRIAGSTTTTGAGGSLTSTAVGDALKLVCRVANTDWIVVSSMGNWTVV